MRAKPAVLLSVALGCGLVAAIGVTQVVSKREPVAPTGGMRSVVVAGKDIASGELITPQAVRLDSWPKEKVPQDCLTQIDKVDGCRARVEIYEGEPILEKKLLGQGVTRRTATDYIPKGYRVVPVRVDMGSGGAGLIQPGDRVDVLVHLARNVEKGVPENRTQTILQDIKVFAVDDTFKLDTAAKEEDSIDAKVIQLLVTPDAAETLVLAQQLGKVQLIMRPPGDTETTVTRGKTPAELLGQRGVHDRPPEETGTNQPDKRRSGGLWGFLDQMNTKPPQPQANPQPTPQPENETWNMRLLSGSELTDVTMEESVESSGERVWRVGVGGLAPPQEPPATPDATIAAPPAPNTPQPPQPQATPKTQPTESDKTEAGDAATAKPAND